MTEIINPTICQGTNNGLKNENPNYVSVSSNEGHRQVGCEHCVAIRVSKQGHIFPVNNIILCGAEPGEKAKSVSIEYDQPDENLLDVRKELATQDMKPLCKHAHPLTTR